MAIKDKSDSEYFEWTTEEEIQLFSALNGLKPVGINKHFFMACILDRLSKALNRKVTSDQVWAHLKTMYNLKALDELEPLPFPNEQTNFSLPESEFSIKSKLSDDELESTSVKTESDNKKYSKTESESSKYPTKRTRGSLSTESPANTPPSSSQQQNTKRRRI